MRIPENQLSLIKFALSKLPKNDARVFLGLFDSMMDRAYSWPLWGAVYVINSGCSDDTFSDFRAYDDGCTLARARNDSTAALAQAKYPSSHPALVPNPEPLCS